MPEDQMRGMKMVLDPTSPISKNKGSYVVTSVEELYSII